MSNYSIIGGGISGLCIAYFLKKQGHSLTIYEKSKQCGGVIQTEKTPYGLIHHGPHLMRSNVEISNFFQEIGIEILPAINTKKYIGNFTNSDFLQIKPSFLQILNIVKHLFYNKKQNYNSLAEFASHHFSPLISNNFIQAICNGIYAEDIHNLDHEIALKKLCFVEKKAIYKLIKSLGGIQKQHIITPQNGFGEVINRLTEILKDNIIYNTQIDDIAKLQGTKIITIPALYAKNLTGISNETQNFLSKISYSSVYVTTIFTTKPISKQGIGILTPAKTGILGILFNTSAFESAQNGLHSYSIFSKNLEHSQIVETFAKIFNVQIAKSYYNIYANSIPIYNSHIKKFINHNKSLNDEIQFFSNYTGSIAISEIITSAKYLAEKLT